MAAFDVNELNCGEQIFDLAFHPRVDVLSVGRVDGAVCLYKYGIEDEVKAGGGSSVTSASPRPGGGQELVMKLTHHNMAACRGVAFSEEGDRLYSVSSDKSIHVVDTSGSTVLSIPQAHDDPINKLHILTGQSGGGSYDIFATGDDAGCVKLWDTRVSNIAEAAVMKWHLHEDFVSGMCYSSDVNTLLSVSGDATLCVYDLRKQDKAERSDDQEAELHCVDIIRHGRKVVCGTQDGVLLFFTWSRWGDCSDRYPGHPETIDCMLKIDENTVITGSSDGLIRVVNLMPNKVLGILGDHEEFPVEGMRRSRDGKLLASYAHDEIVRFWDISVLVDEDGEGEADEGEGDDDDDDKDDGAMDDNEEGSNGEDKDEEGNWEEMESESSEFDSGSDDSDDEKAGGGEW